MCYGSAGSLQQKLRQGSGSTGKKTYEFEVTTKKILPTPSISLSGRKMGRKWKEGGWKAAVQEAAGHDVAPQELEGEVEGPSHPFSLHPRFFPLSISFSAGRANDAQIGKSLDPSLRCTHSTHPQTCHRSRGCREKPDRRTGAALPVHSKEEGWKDVLGEEERLGRG